MSGAESTLFTVLRTARELRSARRDLPVRSLGRLLAPPKYLLVGGSYRKGCFRLPVSQGYKTFTFSEKKKKETRVIASVLVCDFSQGAHEKMPVSPQFIRIRIMGSSTFTRTT